MFDSRFSASGAVAHRLSALSLVVLLAACGSSVKLDEAPVQDVPATPIGSGGAGGTGSGSTDAGAAGQRPVSPVELGTQTPADAPAELQRIVYFDYDSFEIKPEFTRVLEANAKYLKGNPNARVGLEGHTDERGGREYNLALGQKRAEAVRRALALLGVRDAQMEAVSFGEEKPAQVGTTEAAYSRNRRVEITAR